MARAAKKVTHPYMGQAEEREKLSGFRFSIGTKLSVFLSFAFVAVLLVGGISLLSARSISLSTEGIKRQSQHVEVMDGVHVSIHHLFSAVRQAIIDGTPPLRSTARGSSRTSIGSSSSIRSWRRRSPTSPRSLGRNRSTRRSSGWFPTSSHFPKGSLRPSRGRRP